VLQSLSDLTVFTDGGARGNPGPAAIGFSVMHKGEEIYSHKECIGQTTNNVAEYSAILSALSHIATCFNPQKLTCFLDSLLVVNQINGKFKIKQEHLCAYVVQIYTQIDKLKRAGCKEITFSYIPREKNKRADELVNQALDA